MFTPFFPYSFKWNKKEIKTFLGPGSDVTWLCYHVLPFWPFPCFISELRMDNSLIHG